MAVLPLPLQQGVVVVVSPVPRAAPSLRVVDHCSVEGLVDPPRDLVRLVRDTRSAGSTLASEATQEQKVARVRDTSKTRVTQRDASFDTRALADITLVKVSALKGINGPCSCSDFSETEKKQVEEEAFSSQKASGLFSDEEYTTW